MKFICQRCGVESEFKIGSRISLVCQQCGCSDLRFNESIVVQPVYPGDAVGPKMTVLVGESFFGLHQGSWVWDTLAYAPLVEAPKIPIGEATLKDKEILPGDGEFPIPKPLGVKKPKRLKRGILV